MQRPNDQCARLRVKRSGVKTYLDQSFCVLGQNPLPSLCLTLHPGVQMGTGGLSGKPDEMLGVNLGVE